MAVAAEVVEKVLAHCKDPWQNDAHEGGIVEAEVEHYDQILGTVSSVVAPVWDLEDHVEVAELAHELALVDRMGWQVEEVG